MNRPQVYESVAENTGLGKTWVKTSVNDDSCIAIAVFTHLTNVTNGYLADGFAVAIDGTMLSNIGTVLSRFVLQISRIFLIDRAEYVRNRTKPTN